MNDISTDRDFAVENCLFICRLLESLFRQKQNTHRPATNQKSKRLDALTQIFERGDAFSFQRTLRKRPIQGPTISNSHNESQRVFQFQFYALGGSPVKSPVGQLKIDRGAYGVLVGMDWASEKHDVAWRRSGSGDVHLEQIAHTPEDLEAWVRELRERADGRKILVCLEQRRGALIYCLMKYDFVVIAPLDPARLSAYRDAVQSTSGAKDDPTDAGFGLLVQTSGTIADLGA